VKKKVLSNYSLPPYKTAKTPDFSLGGGGSVNGYSFEYGLKLGGFKGKSYLKMIDWQAEKAEDNFKRTGQITVIILDKLSRI
jgi:hypothetical protein